MPPRVSVLLGVWAAAAASGLFAQSDPPSEHSEARGRPAWEAGQQAFAQQYLAVPPREAPDDPRAPARSVEPRANYAPAVDLEPGPQAVEPERESSPHFESGGWSDPAGRRQGSRPLEDDAPARAPESDGAGFDVSASSSHAEPTEPPQLLPPPETPVRPVQPFSDLPERRLEPSRDAPNAVVAAQHLQDEGSRPAMPEVSGDASAPAESTEATPDASDGGALPLAQPREAMPLEPPGTASSEGARPRVGGLPSVATVVGALAVVLGIFFAVMWGMRRAAPGALTALPSQVVEVLGRAPLAGRQQVHLVRCGNKLLLVSVTPDAAETLTEITDPTEVDRLAGLCEQMRPHSSSAAFRRVFQQYAHDGERTHAI